MTEQQATDMLAKLDALIVIGNDLVELLAWFATTNPLALGLIWGAITWRLLVLTKNQRHIW